MTGGGIQAKILTLRSTREEGWVYSVQAVTLTPRCHHFHHHQHHRCQNDHLKHLDHHHPARALRALGLLLADGTPTGGRGEDFLSRQPNFFTETAVTPERKVEKSFPRWEINRHVEG